LLIYLIEIDMKQIFNDKNLFLVSLMIALFFTFLYLNHYYFKIDFVLIGVFQELLTLPTMVFQVVLLVIATMNFVSNKYALKPYSILSMGILLTSSILTWGSLFS
jgi:hypothetical protein